MCGIAGVISLDGSRIDRKLLERMTEVQEKRGPDDQGMWTKNSVGFGHRRLSIIDLSDAGHQPMTSLDGKFTITYNGEMYNYVELRQELKDLGHDFFSKSDTEVILKAYEVWGNSCVDRFIGMWAFAIWDDVKKELFCSRDPFGIKPFFYMQKKSTFFFASDIRALLLVGNDAKDPDWTYLISQLSYLRFSRDNETFYRQIRSLRPATNLVIKNGNLRFEKYWDISLPEIRGNYDYENPLETFRTLFTDSVRIHFRSDVPVGVCLSGGLDSSSIVAVASTSLDARLKTFSIDYPDSAWSEGEFIDEINAMYRCDAIKSTPEGAQDYIDTLDQMVMSHGEPNQGIGVYSQWKVMELASGQVKVLLDGQGADELLAGYPYFYETYISYLIRSLKLVKAYFEYRAYRPYASTHFGRNIVSKSFPKLADIYRMVLGKAGSQDFLNALHPELKSTVFPSTDQIATDNLFLIDRDTGYSSPQFDDPLAEHLYETITKNLLQSLLYFEDRNSMAFSLESRVPFLDKRLVEFCLGLLPEHRLDSGFTKVILRKSLNDLLPEAVALRRDKKGFPTPLSFWLKGPLMKQVKNLLLDDRVSARKVLNMPVIEKKLDAHYKGIADHTVEIFNWITLELWFQRFQDNNFF